MKACDGWQNWTHGPYGHLKSKFGEIAAYVWLSCQVRTLECDMSFAPYYVSRLLCCYCARHGLQQLISRCRNLQCHAVQAETRSAFTVVLICKFET